MKKVICVVEDERRSTNLVAQYLKKEGYEVRSYYTYEEAVAHVQDEIGVDDRAQAMCDDEARPPMHERLHGSDDVALGARVQPSYLIDSTKATA